MAQIDINLTSPGRTFAKQLPYRASVRTPDGGVVYRYGATPEEAKAKIPQAALAAPRSGRREIAVGDLGEFWYGDYKQPFVQLEGAVPGYPRGTILHDDAGKALCAFCGKTYHNLGKHAFHMHGLPAQQYKAEVGLLQKTALVSEAFRMKNSRNMLRRIKDGKLSTFQSGNRYRPRHPKGGGHLTEERLNKTGQCYAQTLAVARSLPRVSMKGMLSRGINYQAVKRYFGGFEGLRAALQQPPFYFTDEQLLAALKSLAIDLGRTPTASDMRRFGMPNPTTFIKRFGSWVDACIRADLDPNLPQPDDEVLSKLLVAFATTGSVLEACRTISIDSGRGYRMLRTLGWLPDGRMTTRQTRREWAVEMSHRLLDNG